MDLHEPPTPSAAAPTGFFHHDSGHWRDRYRDTETERTDSGQLSPHTLATYLAKIKLFLDWWAAHHPDKPLTMTLANAYQAWAKAQWNETHRFTEQTYGLCLSGVRRWATYLVAQEQLAANPFLTVHGPRPLEWHAHGFLTRAEVKQLLKAFDQTVLIEQRDYLICYLMLKTGARETELCGATVGDLELMGSEAFLYLKSKGKKKTPREPVLLRPQVTHKVLAYLARRGHADTPLPSSAPLLAPMRDFGDRRSPHMSGPEMRRRIQLAVTRAGLTTRRLTGLTLRHTAAIHAFLNKAPAEDVQAMMRHANIKTTYIFKRRADRIRRGGERYLDQLE